jgi:hypothetical protein
VYAEHQPDWIARREMDDDEGERDYGDEDRNAVEYTSEDVPDQVVNPRGAATMVTAQRTQIDIAWSLSLEGVRAYEPSCSWSRARPLPHDPPEKVMTCE